MDRLAMQHDEFHNRAHALVNACQEYIYQHPDDEGHSDQLNDAINQFVIDLVTFGDEVDEAEKETT